MPPPVVRKELLLLVLTIFQSLPARENFWKIVRPLGQAAHLGSQPARSLFVRQLDRASTADSLAMQIRTAPLKRSSIDFVLAFRCTSTTLLDEGWMKMEQQPDRRSEFHSPDKHCHPSRKFSGL